MTPPSDLDPATAARLDALDAAVTDLRRRLAALEAGGAGAPADQAEPVDPWSEPPWPEIVAELRRGKKINAIKVLVDYSGMGLADAKRTVEDAERRLGDRLR